MRSAMVEVCFACIGPFCNYAVSLGGRGYKLSMHVLPAHMKLNVMDILYPCTYILKTCLSLGVNKITARQSAGSDTLAVFPW